MTKSIPSDRAAEVIGEVERVKERLWAALMHPALRALAFFHPFFHPGLYGAACALRLSAGS